MAQLRETTVNGDLTVLGDIKIDRDGDYVKYSLYPLGSVYCSSTVKSNEELVAEIGGAKWELIDKEFSSAAGTGEINTLCSEAGTAWMGESLQLNYSRAGHNLTFQVTGTANRSWLYRTDIGMATITLSSMGVSYLPYDSTGIGDNPGDNSNNPAIVTLKLTKGTEEGTTITNVYSSKDTKYKSEKGKSILISQGVVRASYPDGWGGDKFRKAPISCTFNFTIPHESMLDEACNKFYYKRVE